jgi:hypothetical protein
MIRPPLALLVLLGLAACAQNAPRLRGSAAQEASCARRADEVYDRQNRADVYRSDQYASTGRDAPFGGGSFLNAPSLSDRYAREKLLDNCLAGRTGAAGAAPEPADPFTAAGPAKLAPPPPKP